MAVYERVSIGSLAQGAAPPGYTHTRSTTGLYIDSDGLLKSAAINTPRRQWDATNRRWGYVGEPGGTNLLLQSEDFSTTWSRTNLLAFGSGSVVNATAAPDGNTTADLLVPTTSSATHAVSQGVTVTAVGYSVSVFVKSAGYSKVAIREGNVTGAYACFSLAGSGSVITQSAATGRIVSVGNGWYRIDITYNGTAASHVYVLHVLDDSYASGSPHLYSYAGDGTSGLYIWGAQLEAGPYPTSYIPTTTVSVSRGADLLTRALTGPEGTALSTQGTMVVEFSFLGGGSAVLTGDRALATLDGGSYANSMNIYNRSGAVGVNAGNGTFGQAGAAVAVSQRAKCAFAWSSSRVNFALDGTLQGAADATVTIPAVTSLTFGASAYFGALYGLVYGWTIYDDAKTDAELQALTTPTTNRNQSRLTLGLGLGL